MAKAVYLGSFDPVHNGHIDIAMRATLLFDELVIGIYDIPPKALMFTTKERVELFERSMAGIPNVQVESFNGLAPEFAHNIGANFILRGLRAGFDFETEFEMALMWRHLDPQIDVVCMMSKLEYQFVYSSRIREVALLGGNIDSLVPKHVSAALKTKITPIL